MITLKYAIMIKNMIFVYQKEKKSDVFLMIITLKLVMTMLILLKKMNVMTSITIWKTKNLVFSRKLFQNVLPHPKEKLRLCNYRYEIYEFFFNRYFI